MTTLLVANRGEIARRIFRTARRMGLRCVAVYSDADAEAPFVGEADEAVRIGPAPAAESYLDAGAILDAARATGAELVHPGYGFLAEDPAFARACAEAGLVFVGPSPEVLALMGDKAAAKRQAEAAGVSVLPGYAGEDQTDDALMAAAEAIGFPVLVKPAAGGGGKGMAVAHDPAGLAEVLASSRRVAMAAFGDERLLLERYLAHPRHVEVQVLADHHGSVVHLGERDCSLQRRHQKILEETPSPAVDDALRTRLCEAAVALARHVGYTNAGTCEFLVGDDGTFGFIEMNARLQVEHPVTEMVTGLDLVELQLRVAQGEVLPRAEAPRNGHAMEVRVYAEDPAQGFLPQAGRVLHLAWPPDVRVDSGIEQGTDVTTHYDPMLAKIVVHAADRAGALWTLRRVLGETRLLGVRTNLPFLAAVVADTVVADGKITTTWLEEAYASWRPPEVDLVPEAAAVALAAAAEAERIGRARDADPWTDLGAWRASGPAPVRVVVHRGDEEVTVPVHGRGPYRVGEMALERDADGWSVNGERCAAVREGDRWHVWALGAPWELDVGPVPRRAEEAGPAHLGSPLPGAVIAVRVAPGDRVVRGQELVVIEAMKMEHAIKAPADGTVTAVLCEPGKQVDRDQPLVDFEPEREQIP